MLPLSERILISGGLGFLGFHLCRRFLGEDPHRSLTIVDNLSSTQLDVSTLSDNTSIVIEDFRRFEPTEPYDVVCHLAGPVGSLGILPRNGYVAKDILDLAMKAAEVALAADAVLLHVSSSEVYGRGGVQCEDEEKVVPARIGTRMEYALGKLAAEHALLNLAQETGLVLKICRPFNVIGDGQSSGNGFVVPTFFERALKNEAIPVYYDGNQRRSFCDVRDAVEGILAVLKEGRSHTTYNVGHDANIITIRRLAEQIRDLCSSDSRLEFLDPKTVHGDRYVEGFDKIPDLSKVKHDTGWSPRFGLAEALERIHRHYVASGQVC